MPFCSGWQGGFWVCEGSGGDLHSAAFLRRCVIARGFSFCKEAALFSLLLLAGGVFIAYTPKSGKIFLRLMGTTLLSSFLLGGGAQLLFTFTQAQRLFGQGLIVERIYPWWLLPWAVLLAYVLLKLGAGWIETHICRRREFCTVAVFRQGRCAEVRTLIDTGNGLKQADDRGVAILEMQAVLPLFSAEEGMRLLSGSREGLEWLAFSSLGNPNGRLWGIRAEKLILFFGEKSICHRDIFVGIAEEAFTGSYEGIVPPSLWKEDSE